jgi:hypothetical protein
MVRGIVNQAPSIEVCTPSKGETVDTDFCYALLSLGIYTVCHGLTVGNAGLFRGALSRRRQTPHRARNWLVRRTLERAPKVTHLLWIDDDHVFPADTATRLLAHDKDIVGCLHRIRMPPYHIVGVLEPADIDLFSAGGLHRALSLGSGLLMVKRHVYETMAGPWYLEVRDASLAGTDRIDPDNVDGDISEDVYFCLAAQQAGFEIWCDLDLTYEVGHKNGSETIWFRNPPPRPPYPIAEK